MDPFSPLVLSPSASSDGQQQQQQQNDPSPSQEHQGSPHPFSPLVLTPSASSDAINTNNDNNIAGLPVQRLPRESLAVHFEIESETTMPPVGGTAAAMTAFVTTTRRPSAATPDTQPATNVTTGSDNNDSGSNNNSKEVTFTFPDTDPATNVSTGTGSDSANNNNGSSSSSNNNNNSSNSGMGVTFTFPDTNPAIHAPTGTGSDSANNNNDSSMEDDDGMEDDDDVDGPFWQPLLMLAYQTPDYYMFPRDGPRSNNRKIYEYEKFNPLFGYLHRDKKKLYSAFNGVEDTLEKLSELISNEQKSAFYTLKEQVDINRQVSKYFKKVEKHILRRNIQPVKWQQDDDRNLKTVPQILEQSINAVVDGAFRGSGNIDGCIDVYTLSTKAIGEYTESFVLIWEKRNDAGNLVKNLLSTALGYEYESFITLELFDCGRRHATDNGNNKNPGIMLQIIGQDKEEFGSLLSLTLQALSKSPPTPNSYFFNKKIKSIEINGLGGIGIPPPTALSFILGDNRRRNAILDVDTAHGGGNNNSMGCYSADLEIIANQLRSAIEKFLLTQLVLTSSTSDKAKLILKNIRFNGSRHDDDLLSKCSGLLLLDHCEFKLRSKDEVVWYKISTVPTEMACD